MFLSLFLAYFMHDVFTRLCPQCSVSVNVKKLECVCGHAFCKRRSIATKEIKRIERKCERELEPEGTTSMRRECDRLSKARHRTRAPLQTCKNHCLL